MGITKTYFSQLQISLLVVAAIFLLLTIWMHFKNKEKLSLLFLIFTSFCVFSFAALLDPFLNIWDERFHALVAKNLMNNPLKPTLYADPIVNMAYDGWDKFHIWLHKQPLFLWQIAISFKVFGISEFTLRIPSIIMGACIVLCSYRIGKLVVDARTGLVAGLFVLSSFYLIQIISGRQVTDHNDAAFLAYVVLSIWAFIEYYYSQNRYWIIFIGLFSGMAILCKWLVGLLVYSGWAYIRLLEKRYKIKENKDFIQALLITVIVALPWQLFTLIAYPVEANNALRYNSLHFTTVIEGHAQPFFYHFNMVNVFYGEIASFLIIPALYILYKKSNNKNVYFALITMILMVYLFFSFAKTKLPNFTIIILPIIFIAFAAMFNSFVNYINSFVKINVFKKIIFVLLLIGLLLFKLDIEKLQEKHTMWKEDNSYTKMLTHNKNVFKSLNLPANAVIFNVKGRHYVEAMFYSGLPAYNFIPSKEQYLNIKLKNRIAAVFVKSKEELPYYMQNDHNLIVISDELQGYR